MRVAIQSDGYPDKLLSSNQAEFIRTALITDIMCEVLFFVSMENLPFIRLFESGCFSFLKNLHYYKAFFGKRFT